jgi:hypothetical protein
MLLAPFPDALPLDGSWALLRAPSLLLKVGLGWLA